MKLNKLFIAITLTVSSQGAIAASTADMLEATRVIDQNKSGVATSCIVMNDTMDGSPVQSDIRAYIEIKNKSGDTVPADAIVNESSICVTGLDFGTSYTAILKKGLKSANDYTLLKNQSIDFTTINASESLKFMSGNILSSASKNKKVAVESINLDSFKATLFRISNDDLASYYNQSLGDIKWKWDGISYIQDHGSFVASKEYTVQNKPNQSQITVIDLNDFNNTTASGSYVLLLTSKDTETCDATLTCLDSISESQNMSAFKSIVITDLGLTAYSKKDGIDIAVRSLSTALPSADAELTLINSANEILETVKTDKNGYASFSKEAVSGKGARQPVIVKVKKGNDFYALDLRQEPLFFDGLTASSNSSNNTNVYAYTNRTLVRPGEKIWYQAIVRDSKLNAANFKALKLMIYRPDGMLFEEKTLNKPESGAFGTEYQFNNHAQFGNWIFAIGFDKNNILNRTKVTVDSFIPSTIEANLQESDAPFTPGEKIQANVKYTYDAPASDINISGEYLVKPDTHPQGKWKDYFFGPSDIESNSYSGVISEVQTDAKGQAALDVSEIQNYEFPQIIHVKGFFTDPNSKLITKSSDYKVKFEGSMPGVKTDFSKENPHETAFKVILADQNGKLHEGRVQYTIMKQHYSYQFAFVDDHWEYLENKYQTPVTSGEIDVASDDNAKIVSELEDGSYTITLKFGERTTSADFYTGYASDLDAHHPDRLEIFTDKQSYNKGETAYIEFDSQYEGYADLMLDGLSQNTLKHYKIVQGHNLIPVDVNNDFVKGSYAIVTAYANQESKFTGPRRSIGIAYLNIAQNDRILNVSSDLPKTIKPNSSLDIKVKVDNADDNTYVTAALVDTGILAVNGQKAPTPDKNLYNSKILHSSVYDVYSYLMKSVDSKGQGYGGVDEDEGGNPDALSNITKELLSCYTPSQKVTDGYANVHCDLGSISSSAKLMVSAWSKDKLGSYSDTVAVRDSAVSKLNMPWYLHTGDSIQAPFSINNVDGNTNKFTYTIKCSGAISCDANGDLEVTKGATMSVPVPVKANKEGIGYANITVKGDGYNFETQKEYEVLTPYSWVTENLISVLNTGAEKEIKFQNPFVNGTNARVAIGQAPVTDVDLLVDGLINSNCCGMNSRISAGLAALNVTKKAGKSNDEHQRKLNMFIYDTVAYIQSSINAYGSLSEDMDVDSDYSVAYAAEFLIKANKAGFSVNKGILNKVKEHLESSQNNNSDNIASLSMLDLALMGSSVRTNAVYRFDRLDDSQNHEIEAMANYAEIFTLYGDKNRADAALNRATKLLSDVQNLDNPYQPNRVDSDILDFVKQVRTYLPYSVNTIEHDTLKLIYVALKAKNNDVLPVLYSFIKTGSTYTPASIAVLSDIASLGSAPASIQKLTTTGGTINVKVPESNESAAIATITASGYVQGTAQGQSMVTFNRKYFDLKGNPLKKPLEININQDVLVIDSLKFNNGYYGPITYEIKLPANTILNRVLDKYTMDNKYKSLSGTIGYFTYKTGDTSIKFQANVSSGKGGVLSVPYILKGAYKGTSVPLMMSGKINLSSGGVFNALDSNDVVTVK